MRKIINEAQLKILKYPLEIKRDLKAWRALAGIWKKRKLSNVLRWQKEIRKEWERKLPMPK